MNSYLLMTVELIRLKAVSEQYQKISMHCTKFKKRLKERLVNMFEKQV